MFKMLIVISYLIISLIILVRSYVLLGSALALVDKRSSSLHRVQLTPLLHLHDEHALWVSCINANACEGSPCPKMCSSPGEVQLCTLSLSLSRLSLPKRLPPNIWPAQDKCTTTDTAFYFYSVRMAQENRAGGTAARRCLQMIHTAPKHCGSG